MLAEGITGNSGNFRIVIRFFDEYDDEQEAERHQHNSREAAVYESPAQQCRVKHQKGNESRRDVTLTACTTRQ
ncbi:MAG TPA: hypothetical protein VE377_14765 [Candidatus Dormibacteraeota bacterium]|nr:hypothetical protein [Candidatus Dormibacteraeota bacterium]